MKTKTVKYKKAKVGQPVQFYEEPDAEPRAAVITWVDRHQPCFNVDLIEIETHRKWGSIQRGPRFAVKKPYWVPL